MLETLSVRSRRRCLIDLVDDSARRIQPSASSLRQSSTATSRARRLVPCVRWPPSVASSVEPGQRGPTSVEMQACRCHVGTSIHRSPYWKASATKARARSLGTCDLTRAESVDVGLATRRQGTSHRRRRRLAERRSTFAWTRRLR